MLIYLSMIETPEDKDKFEQIYYKYKENANMFFYIFSQIGSHPHGRLPY